MTPSIEDKVQRPVRYLTAISQRHPGLWKSVDLLRANRDQIQQKYHWPTWCYLPLGGAGGILGPPTLNHETDLKIEASKVAALASWRLAKDIYVFDETVFEELWNTPMEGNIPIDVLYRLPTLCAYVPFPAPRDIEDGESRGKAYGFFVHLNYTSAPVLMMASDYGPVDDIAVDCIPLVPFPLELHEGRDLLQCLTTMHEKVQRRTASEGVQLKYKSAEIERIVQPGAVKSVLEPLLSLTLYLCSASAEVKARDPFRGLRGKAYTKKTKRGVRTFVPDQPQVWEVAYRIGATLRAATAAATPQSSDGGGTHASPRPHIRRAHWHSYWTGPKAKVGEASALAREIVLKWIPPIPIAMPSDAEAIPTVHRVTR